MQGFMSDMEIIHQNMEILAYENGENLQDESVMAKNSRF